MARPIGSTKLTQEHLDKTNAYLDRKIAGKECPFVEELAVYELNVDTHTISNWCNYAQDKDWRKKVSKAKRQLHDSYFSTIKKLSDLQLHYLKVKGLKDGRNAVAIFLMKANHGMIETNRFEHGGIGGGPIETKVIEVADV